MYQDTKTFIPTDTQTCKYPVGNMIYHFFESPGWAFRGFGSVGSASLEMHAEPMPMVSGACCRCLFIACEPEMVGTWWLGLGGFWEMVGLRSGGLGLVVVR